jgi:hypothetical protein
MEDGADSGGATLGGGQRRWGRFENIPIWGFQGVNSLIL